MTFARRPGPEGQTADEPKRSWLYAERHAHDGGGADDLFLFVVVFFPGLVLCAVLFFWVAETLAFVLLALLVLGAIVKALQDA